jgi:hypothetical protein
MNREDLTTALAALKRHLDDRVELWRVALDPETGREIKRIYRGTFRRGPFQRPDNKEK